MALRPETVRLLAPAMNEHMWRQPVVQRNLAALEALGIVREVTGKQRSRVFAYRDFLRILDDGTEVAAAL